MSKLLISTSSLIPKSDANVLTLILGILRLSLITLHALCVGAAIPILL